MQIKNLLCYFIFLPMLALAQYPFEKFKSPKYQTINFSKNSSANQTTYSKTVTSFFLDKTDLKLKIISNFENPTQAIILLEHHKKTSRFTEQIIVQDLDNFLVAEMNSDGKKDIKIINSYMGNGLAALNVRVIYFFQNKNKGFTKISFDDMMIGNRLERDLNSDGNFEIITMRLQNHKNHNYWVFNAYNLENNTLKCLSQKVNFPMMVQYLNVNNFKPTNKISKKEMLKYQLKTPIEFSIEKN
jgi:hypothetical protein